MLDEAYDCEAKSVVGLRSERCKPDYEEMIKAANIKLQKTIAFRDAACAYFEGTRVREKMAELIGELVMEVYSCQKTVDRLIEQQDADK